MVVGLLWPDLPFVDGAAATFGSDAILGREMFRKQAMGFCQIFKKRQATRIALSHDESGLHKGLPEVGVEQCMSNSAFAEVVCDAPVETDAFPRLAFVF